MKRIVLIILIILLSYNLSLARIEFGVAVFGNYGLGPNSDYNVFAEDITQLWINSRSMQGIAEENYALEEGTRYGTYTGELEARIKIQKDLMFGLGFGVTSLPVGNTKVEYKNNPSYDSINFNMNGNAISLFFTEYYILPVGKILDISFGAGGIYSKASMDYASQTYGMGSLGENIEGTFSSSSGLGFRIKMLLEFKPMENLRVITGLGVKYLNFSGFKGIVKDKIENKEAEKTLYSYQADSEFGSYRIWYPYSSEADAYSKNFNISDLEETSVSLSGIDFYLGVSYYFYGL